MGLIMKKTKRDTSLTWTVSALSHLEVAHDCLVQYTRIVNRLEGAIPDAVQRRLECYNELLNESTASAVKCWQLAGRKISTLRPHLQAARTLADGREAIY